MRDARAGGATVFFSSHILSEVEELCDRVAFIREGRLMRVGPVHEVLRAKRHTVEADCGREPSAAAFEALANVSNVVVNGMHVAFHVEGDMREAIALLARFEPVEMVSHEPSLTDIFVGLYEDDESP